jgi:CheY-like chemotaxis protein
MADSIPPVPNPRSAGAGLHPEAPRARQTDSRRRRRVLIAIPIRVRCTGPASCGSGEVSTTVNVSPLGFLFVTTLPCYSRGLKVQVTFPYSKVADAPHAEQEGHIVRVAELSDGRRAVAIALGGLNSGVGPAVSPASDQDHQHLHSPIARRRSEPKPLVLVLDSESTVLETVKSLLSEEGYEAIAVNNARDGHEVLKLFTPVMVISEIEGEGFPGYDLCAHVKATPRLRRVPVVLVTRTGNPSDYSGAHSLGAVVCMTKPFKNERLLHVARLLAPLKVRTSGK